jgi:two-component sensor histidine kinase
MTMKKDGQAGVKVQASGLAKKNGRAGAKVKSNGLTRQAPFDLHALLHSLQAMSDGEFSVRLPGHWTGLEGKIADTFNQIVAANQKMAQELKRVGQVVGKEGKTRERTRFDQSKGAWGEMEVSVNTLIDDLLRPTIEVTRAIAAVAQGNLTQTVQLDVDGRPLEGEFLRSATKEIHHRVNNNLQIIASLLSLQSDQLKDPDDLVLFEDTQHRVKSMALIHESLYRTGDLAHFSFARYIDSLCNDLLQSYADGTSHVHLHAELDELTFDVDTAVPCGLIVNELLTNALKYAFPDGRSGDIHIVLRAQAGHVTLSVHDTGVGFPADLDFRHTESLGMQLVSMLTEQLGGTITLTRECGTAFAVTFPYDSRPGGDAYAPRPDTHPGT